MAENKSWTLAGIALVLVVLYQGIAAYSNLTATKVFDRARAEKLPALEKELAE
jgi:hypothetical protein